MRIGVVGGGIVGAATARAFMEHAEVRVYDILPERRTHPLDAVLDCELVMVCLPTPQGKDGLACDLSAVEGFFRDNGGSVVNYVLKSTVPVGTTRRLQGEYSLPNLAHSPEFLTARTAFVDAQIPARNIIGVPEPHNDPEYPLFTGTNRAAQALNILYHQRFPGVPVHLMTSDESEFVKLAQNSLFAVKIAAFNELHHFAEKLGLSWDRVRDGILSDGRITHAHTQVPGRDGFGFSGSCLPKDIASLVSQIEGAGLSAAVTRGAMERNVLDRERKA